MICNLCQEHIPRQLSFRELLWPWNLMNQRCQRCTEQLIKLYEPCCPTCLKRQKTNQRCDDCAHWALLYPTYKFQHYAFFAYQGLFKEWLHRYKFLGDYRLRCAFTSEIRTFYQQWQGALICPIPLSEEKEQRRGFNQVKGFLEAAKVPITPLLKKSMSSLPQAHKNREQRLATPQSFSLVVSPEKIQDQTIVIVDDVYTTGRTLFHAAEVLLSHRPHKIVTFSLAR